MVLSDFEVVNGGSELIHLRVKSVYWYLHMFMVQCFFLKDKGYCIYCIFLKVSVYIYSVYLKKEGHFILKV